MEPTYQNLHKRAKDSALEYMPDLPKVNTRESWESFRDELESLDVYEIAHEESDSWNWVIYYGQAMALCVDVPSNDLDRAESQVAEMGASVIGEQFESSGLYGIACLCAYWLVQEAMVEALESCIADLTELAETQLENMES
jgi:hypothetical protein